MNFFFDRCVPIRLARMVAAFEADHFVIHLDDAERFQSTTTDVEWMTTLDKDDRAWTVISADIGIVRNKAERQVLRATRMKFFYLTRQWNKMAFNERAWRLIKAWPQVVYHAETVRGKVFEESGGKSLKVARIE